jgi:hypothetical protein
MGGEFAKTVAYVRGLGAAAALILAFAAPAEAKSCSERLKTCQGFCAKSEGGSPGCLAKCGEYRQACLASGCWESKYVSKECGLRQAIGARPSFERLRSFLHGFLRGDP